MENFVNRLASRVSSLVRRGVCESHKQGKRYQEVTYRGLGDVQRKAEACTLYGFESLPPGGTEILTFHVGGEESHPLAFGCFLKNTDLQAGDVRVFSENKVTILVEDSKIFIEKDRVSITKGGVSLVLSENGVVIDCGGNPLHIDATEITTSFGQTLNATGLHPGPAGA